MGLNIVSGSFRDPCGFIFERDGLLCRQVNRCYSADYDHLMASGLYDELVTQRRLIPHTEMPEARGVTEEAYRIIAPQRLPFISYPYEWCFSQLRDAALLTLEIQRQAISHGMMLKDASAYNVQFLNGRPIFIDTLSFELMQPGAPWVAYRQFCEHFLAPLALMAYRDVRLHSLLKTNIDGIPLDLAAPLLPWSSRLNLSLSIHLHWHARFGQQNGSNANKRDDGLMKAEAISNLLDDLEHLISSLRPSRSRLGAWSDYYDRPPYSESAFEDKSRLIGVMLDAAGPSPVWDIGANSGHFSRLAAERGTPVTAFDIDHDSVEKLYRACQAEDETNILPLIIDLANPSPGIGWMNSERMSLAARGPADTVLALALMHHLVIGNNLPLAKIADCFASLCSNALIIEYIPVDDPQVQYMLAKRGETHANYTREQFEEMISHTFSVEKREPIADSARVLYLLRRKVGC